MGTLFTVYLHDLGEAREQEVFQAVFDEIERVERTFSRFLPSSEIARINREAGQGRSLRTLRSFICWSMQRT